MKTLKVFSAACIISVLFTGCAIKVANNSSTIKQVNEVTLNDGTVTRVGFQSVNADWNCNVLGKHTSNTAMNKFKGNFMFGKQFEVLEQSAIDYANQTQLKPNYIYLYIPTTVAVNDLRSDLFSDSTATYYQCDKVPAVKDKLSDIFN